MQYPRIRGVVSTVLKDTVHVQKVSPHTRGCICIICNSKKRKVSIPAYAGLYRGLMSARTRNAEYPRIRGVVSKVARGIKHADLVSPHTRGCISWRDYNTGACASIPAYAGLYRCLWPRVVRSMKYPRIRGVVSHSALEHGCGNSVSPHTRGCIHVEQAVVVRHRSIPAYAGLYRTAPSDRAQCQ